MLAQARLVKNKSCLVLIGVLGEEQDSAPIFRPVSWRGRPRKQWTPFFEDLQGHWLSDLDLWTLPGLKPFCVCMCVCVWGSAWVHSWVFMCVTELGKEKNIDIYADSASLLLRCGCAFIDECLWLEACLRAAHRVCFSTQTARICQYVFKAQCCAFRVCVKEISLLSCV